MRSITAHTANVTKAFNAYQNLTESAEDGTPAMGMFSGKAGLGKTTAGAWLFTKADGILLRCFKADTLGTFLERLSTELGLETDCTRAKMLSNIIRELAICNRPLFIDEADYLAEKIAVLETLRDIYDLANVPIILIGYEQLPKKVKRLPQLLSRISQHVEFQPANENDIAIMAEQLVEHCEVEPCLLAELLKKSNGNFRLITVGLNSIEKFCVVNGLDSISAQQWAGRMLFPTADL
ncbi:AAA family ATPase [Glaciecola sp. 1036]|uniref:AAA family ATPase n=1 Tax=Alteromonadaceae TaxID=72275 RepID=UPI003D007926